MEFSHYSVMLKETIEELKVKSDGNLCGWNAGWRRTCL